MTTQDQNAIVQMIYNKHLTVSEALVAIRLQIKQLQAQGSTGLAEAIEFYNWVQTSAAKVLL